MNYKDGDAERLTHEFWKELSASPFVMLQLDSDADSTAPMTAQLDKNAEGAIWFFTYRDNRFAAMGPATATFSAKDHDLFARFEGNLVEETSKARLDKEWSNAVEAWFPGGKNDPNLLMLRMELGRATIWRAKLGVKATTKMLLGKDITDDIEGSKVEVAL